MRSTTWFLMAVALVSGVDGIHAQDVDTTAAQKSAETWLALVDNGAYAESWKTAASLFKKAVTEEQSQGMLKTARDPLGKLQERSMKAPTPTKLLRERRRQNTSSSTSTRRSRTKRPSASA